jgi:hypothetical protein
MRLISTLACAIFALSCRSHELVYTGHIDKKAQTDEAALIHVAPVEQLNAHEDFLFNIVIEIDGQPAPLAGLTQAIALYPGTHELVVAIMNELAYSGKQSVIKYFRITCSVAAGQRLRLGSRIYDAGAECWIDDSQTERTVGRQLSAVEAESLAQRHRSYYAELEKSGKLRIR